MEKQINIEIKGEYNPSLEQDIELFCEKIADRCIELSVVDNGNRCVFKP